MGRPLESDVSALRRSVDALVVHSANRLATNQQPGWVARMFDRKLDVPTFLLAVIGAVVSIGVMGAALYPLVKMSLKYWAG